MIISHAQDLLGPQFPQVAAQLIYRCFLPKASFAACLQDGVQAKVCLLSSAGDRVHGACFHGRRVEAMSISPLDGTVAWAPKSNTHGLVILQRRGGKVSELNMASGRVFALSFFSSKPFLVAGLVDEEDQCSVVLFDYANGHMVMTYSLPDIIDADLSVSSDGRFFGVADGWNLMVWDFEEGQQPLLKRRIQPGGLAFTLDSDIITAAVNKSHGTRFLSFEVASGEPAEDHVLHMKYINEAYWFKCPMVYTGLGFLVHLYRSLVLVSSTGEVVLHTRVFECGRVMVLASIVDFADVHTGPDELLYATVIQPVAHEEDPVVIAVAEAAEIVAQQEASFVELSLHDHFEADMPKPSIHLCTLNRCPKELRQLLCHGPELKHVRDALGDESWTGPGGSLIFVEAEFCGPIMSHLEHEAVQLHPSNLIVSSSYCYLVEEVIDRFRKVWCKSNEEIQLRDGGSSRLENDTFAPSSDSRSSSHGNHEIFVELVCEKTFIHATRPAVPDDSVTQSTTRVECLNQVNPRLPPRQL